MGADAGDILDPYKKRAAKGLIIIAKNMIKNDATLQMIWAAELDIMDVFHGVCMSEGLKYQIASNK